MMNSIHVLLVEDSMIAQTVVQTNLIQQGCTVDIAANAQEAMKKTNDCRYDLILMDIGLGNGQNGFDIATQIKTQSTRNKTTSIAALSAHIEEEYKEKAESIGMVGYFKKPFTPKYAEKIIGFVKNNKLIRMIQLMR